MKSIKRLFSLFLGVLTLFTCTQSVLAGGGRIHTLILGHDDAKIKLFKILYPSSDIELGKGYKCSDSNINFFVSKAGDDYNISHYIKTCHILDTYKFNTIIIAVDMDTSKEEIENDIRSFVDFICNYKDEYTQVIVVGCSNRENVPTTDKFVLDISNYVTGIEIECTPNKWGVAHNISFSEQFLCFDFVFKDFNKEKFFKFICDNSKEFKEKKKASPWRKLFIRTGTK